MHPQPRRTAFADEEILYRTRQDVLTTERLITGGQSYPLGQIAGVRVAQAWYVFPLLAARGLAALIALAYLVDSLGGWRVIEEPESIYVRLALVVLAGLFAVGAAWFVQRYALVVTLRKGTQMRALWANDRVALQQVAQVMQDAVEAYNARHAEQN